MIPVVLVLAACNPYVPPNRPDQCLRAKLFAECLDKIPKGPNSVHNSNDWEEVVSTCGSNAYYTSLRKREVIKPDCATE